MHACVDGSAPLLLADAMRTKISCTGHNSELDLRNGCDHGDAHMCLLLMPNKYQCIVTLKFFFYFIRGERIQIPQ